MNRFVIFLGLIAASFMLFRLHIGTYGLDDAFSIIAENQKISDEKDLKNPIRAVVIDPQSEEMFLEDFFKDLDGENLENVFLLAENPSWRGNNAAALWQGEMSLDDSEDFVKKALGAGVKIEMTEEGNYKNLYSIVKKSFKNANVKLLLVQDIATNEEMDDLAKFLSGFEEGKTLLIAASVFSEKMDRHVAEFHDELSRIAIENIDKSAVSQLDAANRPILYLLFSYLEKAGGEKIEIVSHEVRDESSAFFAKFSDGQNEANRELTMMAFGDTMLSRDVRTKMNMYGLDYPFENIKGFQKRFLEGADIIFTNLEGPIKGKGTSGGTAMFFSFNEDSAPLLKDYGFNVVSVANNHAMDQGASGRDTTIAALENAGVGWCGHPHEEDLGSVFYGNVGDKKYALICFQDITAKINDADAVNLIKEVRPNVDYLIVTPHWGYEYKSKADYGTQVEPGRSWIDAGADIVIGHHPHVVQNFEIYNGKFIFYSLGNFIFDQYWSTETQKMLGLGIVLEGGVDNLETKIYLFPLKSENARPRLMNAEEKARWVEDFIKSGDYSEELKSQIRSGILIKNNF